MKNIYIKVLLLNLCLFIILFIIFYLSSFLLGYSSNGGFILERRLFIKFVIAHIILSVLVLHRWKLLNWYSFWLTLILTSAIYLFVAWKAEYFSVS